MTIPAYLPYFVFAGSAATLFAILYGLHRSLVEAKWHAADRARTFRISSVILLGWLAVTVGLGAFGVYHVDSTEVPGVIAAVPQSWLGKLPALFAWPAGIGDIAIGLLAPIVGLAYARAPYKAASLVAGWNVFGILDLMIAVGTGFATAPSLIQPIEVTPTSDLMTVLPMVLIPVYLVPLSIVLHLASLAKLRREAAASNGFGRIVTA